MTEDKTAAEHEDRIDGVLRSAYQKLLARGQEPVFHRTPLSDIVAKEEGEPEGEHRARLEGLSAALEYLFADGPHPGNVIRRAYALCRVQRSDLLLDMSLEQLGMMVGETKAAMSWRIKEIFNGYLQQAGMKGFKLPWQKSEEACGKYRGSARGNTNRRGTTGGSSARRVGGAKTNHKTKKK